MCYYFLKKIEINKDTNKMSIKWSTYSSNIKKVITSKYYTTCYCMHVVHTVAIFGLLNEIR